MGGAGPASDIGGEGMIFINNHILSLVTFFPTAAALFLLMIPGEEKKVLHRLAFFFAAAEFVLSLHLYFHFQNTGTFEFLEMKSWIPVWNVNYLMGIDGVSLLLILLTTLMTPIALVSAFSSVEKRVKEFVICMLILETGMIGVLVLLIFSSSMFFGK